MGPDTVVKKALGWLARRSKNVSKHVGLHNSRRAVAGRTRPWILEKALHSITRGGDRVAKKLVERTIKDADHYILQRNGRHAFTKLFGRQIGKEVDQTALRVIVNDAGKVITAFVLTAAQASATTAAMLVLEECVTEALDAMEKVSMGYDIEKADRDEAFAETIIDFFMDLGNESVNKHENFYMRLEMTRKTKENEYLAKLEQIRGQSISAGSSAWGEQSPRQIEAAKFNEGLAGAALAYIDDGA